MSTHQRPVDGVTFRGHTRRRRSIKKGLTPALATLVVGGAIVLAAWAMGPQNASTSGANINGALIEDLAPVGTPNLNAITPYQPPELRPIAPPANTSGGAYAYPEMWPETTGPTDSGGQLGGPR